MELPIDYLNDIEKVAVQQFYEHKTMREAVRKVLFRSIFSELAPGDPFDELKNLAFVFPSQHPEADNEVIGANLRAIWQGVNALRAGFNNLSNIKREEAKPSKLNKAR